jgi:hypothetical protein
MGAACKLQQSRRFRNHHGKCIGTHDAHCAATCLQSWKPSLQRFICQKVSYDTTYQRGVATYPLAEPRYSGRTARGKKILAPPAGSPPLLKWA